MRKVADERLHLRLPAALKEQMEKDAEDRGMSVSTFLRWIYTEWRRKQKPT